MLILFSFYTLNNETPSFYEERKEESTGLPVKSYEARTFPLSQRFIEDLTGKNLFSYAIGFMKM